MQPKNGNDSVPHEHNRLSKVLELADMNIKLLQKQIKSKELVKQLTKLNSKLNNDLWAEYIGMCSFTIVNLENYNVNTTKEDVKCYSPLTSAQFEDTTINTTDVSLNLPVNKLTNNPEIELPNPNGMLSDDQCNSNTPRSHDNIG